MKIKIHSNSFKLLIIITILFLSIGNASAAQWEVGSGQFYTTIQSAINNGHTHNNDIINVHSGIYSGDVTVNKKLTIQVNKGDNVELKPLNTGFTVINYKTGNGDGSTIKGFKIINSPKGTGVNISASNCYLKNNKIIGGKTGVVVSGSSNAIIDNVISGQSQNGILGNLSSGFCTVSGNHISNIIGEGSVNGISFTINGNLTDFNVIGNIISNIKALGVGSSVFTIQLGKSKGSNGNPEVANVTNLMVTKNIITQISSNSAIMGIELISNSINALIYGNNLSQLKAGTNGSVFALEAAIIGNGNVSVSKNRISQLTADQQACGIVAVALGNLELENNIVSNISKAKAAVGILGLGLLSNGTLENNSVSDITSPNIAAGIVGTAFVHLNMLHNIIMKVNGVNDVSMVAAGFNTTTVMGNNLEGDGSGNGIVICSSNGTINYNRIVNFDYYIQNFKFSSFGPDIDQLLKPIDDAITKHPDLKPILQPIKDDLVKLFHKLEQSNTTATYNWYGTNKPSETKFFKANGTLNYSPWLVLSVSPNPARIHTGENSTITADIYHDSIGVDHSAYSAMFFSGPRITFTTDRGNMDSKSFETQWFNGVATAILRADKYKGIATVTANDYQTVKTGVTILGASNNSTSSVKEPLKISYTARMGKSQTIGMQDTAVPVTGIIFGIMMILGGFIGTKTKQ